MSLFSAFALPPITPVAAAADSETVEENDPLEPEACTTFAVLVILAEALVSASDDDGLLRAAFRPEASCAAD